MVSSEKEQGSHTSSYWKAVSFSPEQDRKLELETLLSVRLGRRRVENVMGVNNKPPQSVPLWYAGCFELKATLALAQEKLLPLP